MKNSGKKGCFLETLFTCRGHDAGILLLRVFAGAMLLPHGIQKAENFQALSTTFADPLGLGPKWSLILIMATEIGGAGLLILGLLTRPAALALVFGMFVAAFLSSPKGFSMDSAQLPLLFLGIFAVLLITGGGRYSLDEGIRRRISVKE